MKIPIPPFHEVNSQLLLALLTGGDCLQYNNVPVNDTQVTTLSPVSGTVYALIVVEADPTTMDKSKVIRFSEMQATIVSAINGLPLGDLGVYEVKGMSNLQNFKAIGIEAGKSHTLRIQYFG